MSKINLCMILIVCTNFSFFVPVFRFMWAYLLYPHVVNNCIKRHVNVPTYSTSGENVMINEYVQGTPMYQQPMMMNNQMMYQQPYMYPYGQYQGNVGVEGIQQEYPNILNQNPYRF